MTDLISREALIKELETFDEEFEPQIDEVYALITNAPAIEQGENVVYLEIENIAQMAGLLVDTPRGLAWEFADIEKLTKFANICAERRYLPNTASTVSQNEQQEVVGYIDEFGNFENSLKQWMIDEPDVEWKPLYTTPQQPQSVADALEEVLKILDGHIDRATTLGQQEEFREAQARIRDLIYRNAEGVV